MFDRRFYKQIFGTPIGSLLSPVIVDLILQDIETSAFDKSKFTLFYFRYVGNVTLAAPRSQFGDILNIFNSFHPQPQFTIEIGIDDKLNFLDVTLIKTNNHLIRD